jgi:hypothetical protein
MSNILNKIELVLSHVYKVDFNKDNVKLKLAIRLSSFTLLAFKLKTELISFAPLKELLSPFHLAFNI